ncbi:ribonuclease H-like protein, partial [Punctularia strigosozonata HHB-11173 SS5]|uniref:ribonuclease H-like protein n=1 Tax=Punctularia strigosozonata (strain HHB-11173) TaxID=741275 RepID=UPI00044172EA
SPEAAVHALYGPLHFNTMPITVHIDGSCVKTPYASAGAGVFWARGAAKNVSARVPGKQTNNRAELYAVLLCLLDSDPLRNLRIVTDSEYAIRLCCYGAPKAAERGWDNDLMLQDVVALLRARLARTHFVWVKGHSRHDANDAADALAKAGTS